MSKNTAKFANAWDCNPNTRETSFSPSPTCEDPPELPFGKEVCGVAGADWKNINLIYRLIELGKGFG